MIIMVSTSINLNFNRSKNILIFPALLLMAQAAIVLAILSFGVRTGGYPIPPVGLSLSAASVLISAAYLSYIYFFSPSFKPLQELTALFAPAVASLMLAAALWMTPWMSGAPYAPFKPGAADTVLFWNVLFLFLSGIIGVAYQSRKFLILCLAFQLSLYVSSYSLLHWALYPYLNIVEGILGIRPMTFIIIVGGYTLAILVLPWRKRHIEFRPNWKFAAIITNLIGGWIAYVMLASFPQNGSYLGWQSVPLTVPEDAWNWSFTAAQTLIIIAMIAPLIGTVISMTRRTGQ
jgi:hypothetical protein